jgi:adenine-specific DNA-methyltransferase
MCDEIFGEENFVASLVWDKNRKNDAKYFSVGHEYMLVYFRNERAMKEKGTILRIEKEGVADIKKLFDKSLLDNNGNISTFKSEYIEYCKSISKGDDREPIKRFKKVDQKGPYRDDGNINWPGGGGPNYEVLHPITRKVCKAPVSGWRFPTIERFLEEYEKGRIVFGVDETTVPKIRTNLFENSEQVMTSVHFSYAQTATNEFLSLFDGERIFDNPKPVSDIEKLVRYVCDDGDTVLDFFAGSSTTAHATMLAGNRIHGDINFISVQLPEKCDARSTAFKNGYKTIADISKERVRRAGNNIRTDLKSQPDFDKAKLPDLGFKVLKLEQSNFKQWQAPSKDISDEALLQQMELLVEHIEPQASQEDLLYELLIKAGVMPSENISQIDLAGSKVFSVADNSLLVHLGDKINQACIDAVLNLAPSQFICLDKAFHGNDQLKTNALKTFQAFNQGKEKIDQIDFKTV